MRTKVKERAVKTLLSILENSNVNTLNIYEMVNVNAFKPCCDLRNLC